MCILGLTPCRVPLGWLELLPGWLEFFLAGWNLSWLAVVSFWLAGISGVFSLLFLAGWNLVLACWSLSLAGWNVFLAGWSRKV